MRLLPGLVFLWFSTVTLADPPATDPLADLPAKSGLIELFADAEQARVMSALPVDGQRYLLVSTLGQALGSNDIGLDRAQNGEPRLVEFRVVGKRALLVQLNTRFVADSADGDEARAARDAFAESVLWSGEVLASKRRPEQAVVDLGSLALLDLHGVADRLRQTQQGDYSIDAKRSVVLAGEAESHPDNIELAALLTFSGRGDGAFAQQAAADARAISLQQRISLVRLPGPGFSPRAYHPASGGYSIGRYDFAQAIESPLEQRWQARFRLQKKDPAAARSEVVKPIVFYLDRGTPEPIRSALLEGANWWAAAFDAAGFINAFRAELAPVGLSMSDVRYNTITWTHRATRGWSYGGGIIDPRSGEIIKGFVNLGSQRVRQDLLIAEGLLAPYRDGADPRLKQEALQMALDRLKQLAAHEVGHALGFAHNFAASRTDSGSVLDYPHPQLRVDESGALRLDRAYDRGVGEWDKFAVAHAYGEFADAQEAKELAALRAAIGARGYDYVSDADARAPSDAHAQGLLWDLPGGALAGLAHALNTRRIALDHFADGALPPDRQWGEAERRLVPIYLLHRYQTDAVARLLGGASYRYGLVGDGAPAISIVPAEQQQQALMALAGLLSVDTLAIPNPVLAVMSPPPNDYARSPEHFGTRMAPLFDPIESARAATALVSLYALQPSRLNRLSWQHANEAAQPSVADLFQQLIAARWLEKAEHGNRLALQVARNGTLLDAALLLLDGGELQPGVAASWRQSLRELGKQLGKRKDANAKAAAEQITRYFEGQAKLRPLPSIPPGAPI